MRLDVNLAGSNLQWYFPGSATLQTWLSERPWKGGGGMCSVRIENDDFVIDQMTQAIRRAAHAAHEDDGLSVQIVHCGASDGTPKQALMGHFGMAPDDSVVQARSTIRNMLIARDRLLLMVARSPIGPDDWDEFIVLGDHYRQTSSPVPLTVIVLDPFANLICQPTCQFDVGYLSQLVLRNAPNASESTVWSRYLHTRAWWDAGGSMRRAYELSSTLMNVNVGDSDSVEEALQLYAIEQLKTSGALVKIRAWLDTPRGQGATQNIEIELRGGGILWIPPGLNSYHLVPWAARALLAQPKPSSKDIWQLRPSLVCAPLAAELLALCLFFESRIRLNLVGRGDVEVVRSETHELHKKFQDDHHDVYNHYPIHHPARPKRSEDIWAFTSLGEFLNCCPRGAISDLDRGVVGLRNHVAHGHYITWHHCERALQILQRWDTAS